MTGAIRLHPLTVVVATAREFLGILLAGAAGLAAAGPATGAWFALAGWLIGSLHQLVRWSTFSYAVHDDRLVLRRAFVGRSVTSVPVERIRGVDISASPLHRLFGLAVVLVDAGGGGDEARLDAVSRREADRLRGLLLNGRAGRSAKGTGGAGETAGPERAEGARWTGLLPATARRPHDRTGPVAVPGPRTATVGRLDPYAGHRSAPRRGEAAVGDQTGEREEAHESGTGTPVHIGDGDLGDTGRAAESQLLARARSSWYLYAPLSGAYLLTPFVLLGVLYNLGDDLGLIREGWFERVAGGALTIGPVIAGLVVLAFVLLMPALSIAVFAMFNWDFTLRAVRSADQAAGDPRAGELVAERGLGTRRSVSLERRRIRGVELRDNPLERLAGVVRLGAVVTGLGDSEQRGRLLPTAPRPIAFEIARRVIGGVPAPLAAHPPAARNRRVVRAITPPLLVALIALAALQPWVALGCVLAALAAVPLGIDRYRQLGHASDGGRLAIQAGSLRRRQAVVEHHAVVGWQVRQTFFQRRLGLATLVAAVGAGDGAYPITDIAEAEVVALAGAVTPDWLCPFIENE